jgi:hypothetical protein
MCFGGKIRKGEVNWPQNRKGLLGIFLLTVPLYFRLYFDLEFTDLDSAKEKNHALYYSLSSDFSFFFV